MRKVHPDEARKGTFLDSFEYTSGNTDDEAPDDVIAFCAVAEASMKHLQARGEIVYTQIPNWGKARGKKGHTWQVFLLP